MFGKREPNEVLDVTRIPEPAVFVEFEGAMAEVEEGGELKFTPRGKINIQISNIGGYYDHTLLLFGNKIRVMETVSEITLKLMEAGR